MTNGYSYKVGIFLLYILMIHTNVYTDIDIRMLGLHLSTILAADQPWAYNQEQQYPELCKLKRLCQDTAISRSNIIAHVSSIPIGEIDEVLKLGDREKIMIYNLNSLIDIIIVMTREHVEAR